MSSNAQSVRSVLGVERYRGLPDDATLASVQRAIAIHDHWETLSERSNGDLISPVPVSLSKDHPSFLKEELQFILDEDLQWTQIYRAMWKLADIDVRYQYIERPRTGLERGDGTVRELHRVVATPGGDDERSA